MKELLIEYLEVIKNIQDCNNDGVPVVYTLNQERIKLHRQIMDCLGLKNEYEYLRLKDVFGNMDKICGIYSQCEEWKLKDESDVKAMSQYLERFFTSAEGSFFLEGKTVPLEKLPCISHNV